MRSGLVIGLGSAVRRSSWCELPSPKLRNRFGDRSAPVADDSGSILPLVVVSFLAFMLVTTLMGEVAGRLAAVTQAQTAADAAALAGAMDGDETAAEVAASNGASLVSAEWVHRPSTGGDTSKVFVVGVEVDGVIRNAAAERVWTGVGPEPSPPSGL